jgi:hypothetical protein
MNTKQLLHSTTPFFLASCLATGLASAAFADPPAAPDILVAQAAPAAPAAPAAAPAAPATWMSTIALAAQIEGGISFNPDTPKTNFGQLYTDHPNQPTLNQVLLTVQRPTDPKATGWDVGFQLQGLYGSDARYTHFLGLLDNALPNDRYQLDITEANVLVHMPVITDAGVDLKVGLYPTPIGYETIDPSTNPFYSHSYIYNFGAPSKHTGVLAILHASPLLDIYGDVDTGTNTTFGYRGDNNSALAGIVGFNLTLMGGNLTILALSHIGSETPSILTPNADSYLRYYNDAVITYKASDTLTLTTELNYAYDDYAKANAGGVAQYAAYTLTPTLTLNGRAEVYADNQNFFVAAYPGNMDAVNAQLGLPSTAYSAKKATTYGEVTLGVTYKPTLPAPVTGLMIRPEIRYDSSLNGTKPYNGGKDSGSLTLAADFVLGF